MTKRCGIRVSIIAVGIAVATLAAHAQTKSVVQIAPVTVAAGATEKMVIVDIRASRVELLAAARNRQQDVTLELDVEAERPPGAFYEVTIGAPRQPAVNVGNIALFGAGIRSEARGEFRPAHVQLVISDQLAAVLGGALTDTMSITFTARGTQGAPASALTINKGEIVIGPRLRQ